MPIFRQRGHWFFGARFARNTYFLPFFYLSFFYIGVSNVSTVSTVSIILLTRPMISLSYSVLLAPFSLSFLQRVHDLRIGDSGRAQVLD